MCASLFYQKSNNLIVKKKRKGNLCRKVMQPAAKQSLKFCLQLSKGKTRIKKYGK